MKLRVRILQGLLLALVLGQTAMGAAAVYKCVDTQGKTAYQSDPCNAGAAETRLNIAAAAADTPVRAAPPAATEATSNAVQLANPSANPVASRRGSFPWGRRTLAVGMSDDEVLNLAGWGRPSSVTRARMPHAWHEDWIYRTAGATEEHHLHFVNMRLVSVDVEPAGAPFIQIAGQ